MHLYFGSYAFWSTDDSPFVCTFYLNSSPEENSLVISIFFFFFYFYGFLSFGFLFSSLISTSSTKFNFTVFFLLGFSIFTYFLASFSINFWFSFSHKVVSRTTFNISSTYDPQCQSPSNQAQTTGISKYSSSSYLFV